MTRCRILVVDDEAEFTEAIVKRMQSRGLDTVGVTSGEKAIEMIVQRVLDVVVLDIRMPGGMDGIRTLREIKRQQPLVEVILLTGHASVETSVEGMKLGAFEYLLKPVKLEDLMQKVGEACAKKAMHEEKIRNARIRQRPPVA